MMFYLNGLTLEVGKPLAEGVGESNGAADIFEWSAEEAKRIYGELYKVDRLTLGYMFIISP